VDVGVDVVADGQDSLGVSREKRDLRCWIEL